MDPLPVRLRPVTEPDLELFDRFATDPALSEPFEWVGFTPPGGYRKRWEQDGLLGSAPYCLAVVTVDGGTLAGWVDWQETQRPGPGAWEIGVLIVPEMRGRGAGSAAQRLATTSAVRHLGVKRCWLRESNLDVESSAGAGADAERSAVGGGD
jgi:RimJ/RimL family protein N-acetyltransferase